MHTGSVQVPKLTFANRKSGFVCPFGTANSCLSNKQTHNWMVGLDDWMFKNNSWQAMLVLKCESNMSVNQYNVVKESIVGAE